MINFEQYVFSCLQDGSNYMQYPDDYSSEIFRKFMAHASERAMIATHRKGDLMYYGYIRSKSKSDSKVGFCLVLNDLMFTDIEQLFIVFEEITAELERKGVRLTNVSGAASQDLNKIRSVVSSRISEMKDITQPLPAINYSKDIAKEKVYSLDKHAPSQRLKEVAQATCRYSFTYTNIVNNADGLNASDKREGDTSFSELAWSAIERVGKLILKTGWEGLKFCWYTIACIGGILFYLAYPFILAFIFCFVFSVLLGE